MGAVHAVLDDVMGKIVDYCSRDETKLALESRVVAPALTYLADKFAWGVHVFQIVAVLVLVQTLLLLWLLVRDAKRGG